MAGGLALARAPASVWRALALAPALAVWKLALLSTAVARPGPDRVGANRPRAGSAGPTA